MIELLETLGRLGRKGGAVFLALGLFFIGINVALQSGVLPINQTLDVVFYSPAAWFFAGMFSLAGLYLVATGGTWKRDTRFKPLSSEQLAAAIETAAPPFCVCLDCMLYLPYEVSVGRCPRCESSGSCLEVHSAADRKTALNAIPPGR